MQSMVFDKNQSIFKSDFHREVWWWAVGLVPVEVSLTEEVRKKCNDNIIKGCYQWQGYFNELCEDMYMNAEEYIPVSARQYRDILENIALNGEIQGDNIIWDKDDWNKYGERINKSKSYINSGITLENCIKILSRTGLTCEYKDGDVIFKNTKYPKIFHSIQTFENSPNVRKTPARHHFAHCEFRQLFKSYSASYDELLRGVSDESRQIAQEIHNYAKSLKIQRYIHFDTIKYKHKGNRVLDFTITGNEYPTLRVNIGTFANPDKASTGTVINLSNDEYYKYLLSANNNICDKFIKNLDKCNNPDHNHLTVTLNGKNQQICPYSKVKINPFHDDIATVLDFIAARKASIDQYN
jgi:hypothetical protein